MNILIPWIPSKWQEITFCVRSIKRYYQDLEHIYIISEINPNIPGTVHYFYPNESFPAPLNYMLRESHLNLKIHTCASELKLNEFIYQGDDQYWLKPIRRSFFQQNRFYLGPIKQEILEERKRSLLTTSNNPYWHWELCLIDTLLYLSANKKPFINYSPHMPTYFTLDELESAHDFYGGWGFQLESGIYNLSRQSIKSQPYVESIRKGFYNQETDLSDIDNYYFLSHDDIGLTNELKDFIVSTFYA